jgi:hypothetical protein
MAIAAASLAVRNAGAMEITRKGPEQVFAPAAL